MILCNKKLASHPKYKVELISIENTKTKTVVLMKIKLIN